MKDKAHATKRKNHRFHSKLFRENDVDTDESERDDHESFSEVHNEYIGDIRQFN